MAAWNCSFCHATNVTSVCGCAKSREAAGRPTVKRNTIADLNAIQIEIPTRHKAR